MKTFSYIGAVCGIFSGIGMICNAVTDNNLPKIVWLFISVGWIVAVSSQICNYFHLKKKNK